MLFSVNFPINFLIFHLYCLVLLLFLIPMQVSSFNFDNLAKQTFKKLPIAPKNAPKHPQKRKNSQQKPICQNNTYGVHHDMVALTTGPGTLKTGQKQKKNLPNFQPIFFFPNPFSSTINSHRNPTHSHLLSITPIPTTFSINLPIPQPQIPPFSHIHQNTPFSHKTNKNGSNG